MQDKAYGKKKILYSYTAAEIELIIGIVTATLIVIYQQNYFLALGTLVGFIILEFMIVTMLHAAENIAYTRQQVEELTDAQRQGRKPKMIKDELGEIKDRFYWVRVIGISVAVTGAIVLVRSVA